MVRFPRNQEIKSYNGVSVGYLLSIIAVACETFCVCVCVRSVAREYEIIGTQADEKVSRDFHTRNVQFVNSTTA